MAEKVTGPKLYCWSGNRQLIICGCEPIDAAALLCRSAYEAGAMDELGLHIKCNETGFKSQSTFTVFTPVVLLKFLCVPYWWSLTRLKGE
jgi:hypothetical protein